MEVRSYNQELAICNILFKRIFSNIKIERIDNNRKKKEITVNCQFGQRSRIFKSWQNAERRANIKLPMILINRSGYSRDTQRINNIHNEVKYEILSNYRLYDYLAPIPISINYEVTIISKYPSDIDQIASNFMVFFNSSIYVSCIHPKYDGIKMNNQVIMDDSVSEDHPDEIDGGTDDFITSTFSFTFKSFLFGGIKQAKKKPKQTLSSYLSTFISSYIIEISPEQIIDFHNKNPTLPVSAVLSSEVTGSITSYINNTSVSDDVYDDFTPVIKQINFGIYPTPIQSSFEDYIEFVDKNFNDNQNPISGYIRSSGYTKKYETYIDEDGKEQQRLSSLIPNDMIYEQVDSYKESEPYVDRRINWIIDEN